MFRLTKLAALAVLLALVAGVQAQDTKPTKKVSEYRTELDTITKAVTNLGDIEFYKKNFTFKNKKTGEERKFSDFKEFEQYMIMLNFIEHVVRTLEKMESTVDGELKKADEGAAAKPEEAAKKDDLQKFLKEVQSLRKTTATKWESHVDNLFKKFEKDIPENQRQLYLKQMREYNDKHKLIERKP